MGQGPVQSTHRALVLFERIIKKEERIMVVDRGAMRRSGDIGVVGG